MPPLPSSIPSPPPARAPSASDRVRHVDALRGLAAMLVVVTHFLAAFLPYAVFGDALKTERHGVGEGLLLRVPFSLLTAGHFAVSLFFVLSGYVLSWRFLGRADRWRDVLTAIVKRPIRLGGLVLLSIGLGVLLWGFDLLWHRPAAALSGSQAWLGTFWPGSFDPAVFVHTLVRLKAGSEYNPPLWTIRIELVGSFLIFGALLVLNPLALRWRIALQIAAIAWLFGSFYQGFFIGMLLGELQRFHGRCGVLRRLRALAGARPVRVLVGVLALALASWPYYARPAIDPRDHVAWLPDVSIATWHFAMAGAALTLVVTLLSPALQRLLHRRWMLWLGDQSFALYVLHFLVLGSVGCGLVVGLTPQIGYLPAVIVSGVVSTVLLFGLSVLATRWVDGPSIRLASAVERWMRGRFFRRSAS